MFVVGAGILRCAGKCPVVKHLCATIQQNGFFTLAHEKNKEKKMEVAEPKNESLEYINKGKGNKKKGYETNCPFAQLMYLYRDTIQRRYDPKQKSVSLTSENKVFVETKVKQPKFEQSTPPKIKEAVEFKLNKLKEKGNYREFIDVERHCGNFPYATWRKNDKEKEVVIWCNNDYLGQGQSRELIHAVQNAVAKSGTGAGGTRNISGTSHYVTLLEKELCQMHNKEAALVFSSGYVANEACLSTLPALLDDCVIISDSLNHASMIEGIKHSKCEKKIFLHNDVNDLRRILNQYDKDRPKIIAFESVYSMDGDIAPIKEICDLAEEHNAITFIDEVHAVGLYGLKGGGVAQRDGESDRTTIISGTFGKAFGSFGGYIAGPKHLIDAVRSFASGFIFTTALPPTSLAASLASVQYLKKASYMREFLHERAYVLKKKLEENNFPVVWSESHIVPLLIGDANLCKQASDRLLSEHGVYVQPINYPTVPVGTERFRLTPTPFHSNEMIDNLIYGLTEVWDTLKIPRTIPEAYDLPPQRNVVKDRPIEHAQFIKEQVKDVELSKFKSINCQRPKNCKSSSYVECPTCEFAFT